MLTLVRALFLAGSLAGGPQIAQGPFLGHVDQQSVSVWARLTEQGIAVMRVTPEAGDGAGREIAATASSDHDLCVVWRVDGLEPATAYRYELDGATGARFVTPGPVGEPGRGVVAFGSCAREDQGTAAVWDQIARQAPDAFVALGDTPYIDSTDLAVQRRRYREFASVPAMQAALDSVSFYATWDDHDFGGQDVNGLLPGKANARQAFIEYHANPFYGDGENGIFTSFRRGPVEVFLLDTRWFARTESSPFDIAQPTLLGAAQWTWLEAALLASDAPFKVLACGMVWNGAVRPRKPDHWGAYRLERAALVRLIGRRRIPGVILVGGDIHRSRVIRHATKRICGYDLTELITSPMHDGVIALANIPHIGLVWDGGVPNSFLIIEADSTVHPARLTARFLDRAGTTLHQATWSADDLEPAQE